MLFSRKTYSIFNFSKKLAYCQKVAITSRSLTRNLNMSYLIRRFAISHQNVVLRLVRFQNIAVSWFWQCNFRFKACSSPAIKNSIRFYSKKLDPEVSSDPIKFIGSPAAAWQAKQGRAGAVDPSEIPWFQPYVVITSVAVFLLYFCVFREEKWVFFI